MTLIICSTVLCGIHLVFLYLDRRKKSGEYKQLKELLEKINEDNDQSKKSAETPQGQDKK